MPLIQRTATSSETQLLCSPHRMQECGSETEWSTRRTLGHQPGCHSPDEDPKVCEKIAPMACRLMRRRLGGSSGVNHDLMISMVDDATDPPLKPTEPDDCWMHLKWVCQCQCHCQVCNNLGHSVSGGWARAPYQENLGREVRREEGGSGKRSGLGEGGGCVQEVEVWVGA